MYNRNKSFEPRFLQVMDHRSQSAHPSVNVLCKWLCKNLASRGRDSRKSNWRSTKIWHERRDWCLADPFWPWRHVLFPEYHTLALILHEASLRPLTLKQDSFYKGGFCAADLLFASVKKVDKCEGYLVKWVRENCYVNLGHCSHKFCSCPSSLHPIQSSHAEIKSQEDGASASKSPGRDPTLFCWGPSDIRKFRSDCNPLCKNGP